MYGLDIIGPLKRKLVATYYFTKCIEVRALANIIAHDMSKFIWEDIICQSDLPHTIANSLILRISLLFV